MSQSNSYVTIRVLFFASAREFTGKKEVFVEVPRIIKGKALRHFITEKYDLEKLKCNIILALNESWVDEDADLNLKNADDVAVIPPLSGG